MNEIHKLAKNFVLDYESREIETSDDVFFSQFETINTIDSYFASKFVDGQRDKLGRYKPFKQVIKPRVNLAHMATDISTKDINIISTEKGHQIGAFILNILARKWMRINEYGIYLNELGHTAPKYGSAVTKFVEHKNVDEPLKGLSVGIVPWQDLVNNQVQFDGSLVIHKFYYSPSELRRKGDVWDKDEIESLITAFTAENKKANSSDKKNLIEVWEVYGDLPLSYLDKEGEDTKNEDKYAEQIHIISYITRQDTKKESYFTLFQGKTDSPFDKYDWSLTNHRALAVGVSEDLLETQVWTNYTERQIRDQLDLASKIFFQTADKQFAAKNVLTEIETGDIFEHEMNQPVTQVNNTATSIVINQNWEQSWENSGDRLASTPEAMFGTTMPSGTAYRQVVALQNAANNSFKQKMQEKGLALRRQWMDRIIPFIVSTVDTQQELYESLTPEELKTIDDAVAIEDRNNAGIDSLLSGQLTSNDAMDKAQNDSLIKSAEQGKKRGIDIKDLNLKDIKYDVEIVITGEQIDKGAQMNTLNTALGMIARNPQILQDPNASKIFGKILEISGGISPLEILNQPQQAQQAPQAPQQAQQVQKVQAQPVQGNPQNVVPAATTG